MAGFGTESLFCLHFYRDFRYNLPMKSTSFLAGRAGSMRKRCGFALIELLVVIAIIAYSLSTVNFTDLQLEKLGATASTAKNVGAGLIFTYILATLAVLSIIYASISRIFK